MVIPMKRLAIAVAISVVAACGEPSVNEFAPRTGIIRGSVIYPGGTARGNVIITLFEQSKLPPPTGTSGPVNFVVVPKADMFGLSPKGTPGDFRAEFTIPTVAPGFYQVRAFLDADEDFNPIYGLLGQVTAGDVGGGVVDQNTGEFRIIEVKENEISQNDVLVVIGREIPVERPSFAHSSTTTFAVPFANPLSMTLQATPFNRAQVKMDPMKTAFLIQYIDNDKDGTPDDINGDHLADVYPTVILRRLPADGDPCQMPACSDIIPLITNPLPFADTLKARGFALATTLELIIPPVSVRTENGKRSIRPVVPAGDYETIVISGTGQTWQVPNDLDRIQPSDTAPSQSVKVQMKPGPALPGGSIAGELRVEADAEGDAYVIAFDARNPPPPQGTGRPVGLASVPRAAFSRGGGTPSAPFVLGALNPGTYILVGLLDTDSSFSPLVSLLQSASASDITTRTPAVVTVIDGDQTTGVSLALDQAYPYDRPAFEMDEGMISRLVPTRIELRTHPIAALGMTADSVRFPVTLANTDVNGDNLPDLLPQVLLTKIVEGTGDDRTAPNDPDTVIIPGIIDPLPFLGALGSGAPLVPTQTLQVILPPLAVRPDGTRIVPIPSGKYRINVVTTFGQVWSVPNDLDIQLGRSGDLADATQGRVLTVPDIAPPGGAVTGMVQLLGVDPPAGDFTVIVLAFDVTDPPPPVGFGRPRANALVPKGAFAGGNLAAYVLAGLPTGTYQIRAFLDADDDFTPWFDTMNQPDQGDFGGGHLSVTPRGPSLNDVRVDALQGAPVTNIDVLIVPQLAVPIDRPVFTLPEAGVVIDPAGGPVSVRLTRVRSNSDVLRADGIFPIQWADVDGDGTANDINGDMLPDVYPLVIAQHLDPDDETNQTPAAPTRLIFGFINPAQFDGFPAMNPTATASVSFAESMDVIFPPIAIDPRQPTVRLAPPAGRYRVTVINSAGQTWSVPNELQRAAGDPLAASQARSLSVSE